MEKADVRRPGNMVLRGALCALVPAVFPVALALSSTGEGAVGGSEGTPDDTGDGADRAEIHKVFNPEGLRDPFKSFVLEQEAPERGEASRPKTYLETVDLSQLELIAVIMAPEDRWAMVRDAKGIGYVVKTGTPIGLDGGRVHEIRPGEVIIQSRHRDADGGIVTRETPKRLMQ